MHLPLSKEEIKTKRKDLLGSSDKTTVIRKGDRRISSATRFCVICQRPLASLVWENGTVIATVTHYSVVLSSWVKVNMCKDIRSCYTHMKGE